MKWSQWEDSHIYNLEAPNGEKSETSKEIERIIKAYVNSNVQRSSVGSLLQNNFQTIPIVPKNNHGPLFGSKCQGSSVGNVSFVSRLFIPKSSGFDIIPHQGCIDHLFKIPWAKAQGWWKFEMRECAYGESSTSEGTYCRKMQKLEAVVN